MLKEKRNHYAFSLYGTSSASSCPQHFYCSPLVCVGLFVHVKVFFSSGDFGIDTFSFSAKTEEELEWEKAASVCSPLDVFFFNKQLRFLFHSEVVRFVFPLLTNWNDIQVIFKRRRDAFESFISYSPGVLILLHTLFFLLVLFVRPCARASERLFLCFCRCYCPTATNMCKREFGLCSCAFRHFNSCSVLNKLFDCTFYSCRTE